jgi:hypothetical protein
MIVDGWMERGVDMDGMGWDGLAFYRCVATCMSA